MEKMEKLGFIINPLKDEYYSFKIVLNNCNETTYYFIEKDANQVKEGEGQ